MKKLLSITFIFCAISFINAQTKLISHKSHSGKSKSFHKSMNKFGNKNSNFGIPYDSKRRVIRRSKLAKSCELKLVNTCSVCASKHYDYDTITYVSNDCILRKIKYKETKKLIFLDKKSKLFKLLINSLDLENLRLNNDLKGECLHNSVLVGFDKRVKIPSIEKEDSKKESIPVIINNSNEPHSYLKYFIVGLMGVISFLLVLFYFKSKKMSNQPNNI